WYSLAVYYTIVPEPTLYKYEFVHFFFFFFFQAEDGIRDKLVTGVQTCALPIFERDLRRQRLDAGCVATGLAELLGHLPPRCRPRSEERRVGKECRSRGSA